MRLEMSKYVIRAEKNVKLFRTLKNIPRPVPRMAWRTGLLVFFQNDILLPAEKFILGREIKEKAEFVFNRTEEEWRNVSQPVMSGGKVDHCSVYNYTALMEGNERYCRKKNSGFFWHNFQVALPFFQKKRKREFCQHLSFLFPCSAPTRSRAPASSTTTASGARPSCPSGTLSARRPSGQSRTPTRSSCPGWPSECSPLVPTST